MAKYKQGDKVEVVGYGHPIWCHKDSELIPSFKVLKTKGNIIFMDMNPYLVGEIGTIDEVSMTQGKPQYSVNGIIGKHAWYNEDQLKLKENE